MLDGKRVLSKLEAGVSPGSLLLLRPPHVAREDDTHVLSSVAATGYVNPQWIEAEVMFVTSSVAPRKGSEGEEEGGDDYGADEITEIRLRWRKLGKVASFKRVSLW
jgi:hypothetical protein